MILLFINLELKYYCRWCLIFGYAKIEILECRFHSDASMKKWLKRCGIKVM